jgi:hypothetical protein
MYWKHMQQDVEKHVKSCSKCQLGKKRKIQYGKLPAKRAVTTPWRYVQVDLIGPYTIHGKDGTVLDFMCLTIINPATSWFEMIELPTNSIKYIQKGREIIEIKFDKSSAQISRLFNRQWLSRYPRPKYIVFDNGSEFKLHFNELCETYNIKQKPTTVKNLQANSVLERIHGVLGNMMQTSGLDNSDTTDKAMVDDFITNASWAVCSTYHTVLKLSPGAAVFGRDMFLEIPYLANWTAIGQRRQKLVDQNNVQENKNRVDFDYRTGQKVLLRKEGILRKAETRYEGPYVITEVHTNGTIRIQRGSWSERLNIRRVTPYYKKAQN